MGHSRATYDAETATAYSAFGARTARCRIPMISRYIFPPPSQPAADWDAKYRRETPAARDPTAYERQDYVRLLLRTVHPGQRVLDAGCGTGGLLHFLHRRGFRVAGVDTSSEAVATARREVPEATVETSSIEALPFADSAFDAYVAIGSWEYLSTGPSKAATEAVRVTRPGGIILIEVPVINTLRRFLYLPLKRAEGVMRTLLGGQPRFAHFFFGIDDLQHLLTAAGSDILDVRPHDLPEKDRHYGLWVDWPFLRGGQQYKLNPLGRFIKRVGNALSPWTIATGVFIVARKK